MHPFSIRAASLLTAGLLFAPLSAATPNSGAAEDPSMILIRAERVIVRPGQVLEDTCVLIVGDRIAQVASDIEAPDGAEVIDAPVVCAGFIDPWSTLGVTSGAVRDERVSADTRTTDAFDPWDGFTRSRALESGVVALCIQAGAAKGVRGLGAVISTSPGEDASSLVLLDDANLGAVIGATERSTSSPSTSRFSRGRSMSRPVTTVRAADIFDRIGQVDKLVGDLHDGLNYAEDLSKYRRELAEWEAQIAEKQGELEEDFKKAKKDREKAVEKAKEDGKEHKDKSYKEDDRPKSPKPSSEKAVFARVANGEVPLVVIAHRSAELRELLIATREYTRLRMIIAGGTEAMSVADELAERRIPVMVWPAPLGVGRPDEWDGHDLGLAGRLQAAGVPVLIGSGGAATSHDLPLLAKLAIGHGLDRETAFDALTYGAARAFDVADQIGSVSRGRRADLLVLDGEPLGPDTQIRHVLVGGRVVIDGGQQ